jgi:hypothetical protein
MAAGATFCHTNCIAPGPACKNSDLTELGIAAIHLSEAMTHPPGERGQNWEQFAIVRNFRITDRRPNSQHTDIAHFFWSDVPGCAVECTTAQLGPAIAVAPATYGGSGPAVAGATPGWLIPPSKTETLVLERAIHTDLRIDCARLDNRKLPRLADQPPNMSRAGKSQILCSTPESQTPGTFSIIQ